MKKKKILITLVVLVGLIIAISGYFLFTTSGSKYIVKFFISNYIDYDSLEIKEAHGNLFTTLVLEGIKIKNIHKIPAEDVTEIQELKITYNLFKENPFEVEVNNGGIDIIGVDKIVFYGSYVGDNLDLTVYTKNLNLRFALKKNSKRLLSDYSGDIENIELSIKGKFKKPQIKGSFLISEVRKDGIKLVNCLGKLDLKINLNQKIKLFGKLLIEKGILTGRKIADINIKKSRIFFDGNYKNPGLNIEGESIIDDVKISIKIKGNYKNPDIELSSKPDLPKQQILLMLTTNKRWKGLSKSLKEGKLTPDIAKTLLDYFIFSGSLSSLITQYNMENINLKIRTDSKVLEIKKDISKELKTTYELEDIKANHGGEISHKIGGKYRINPNLFIGAEKKLKGSEKNRIFLEFKKGF